ncbi:MAG: typA [Chlamydiales bacterium]|jgi:GTP-binding protein|nr:typA [Chlamydiales bacterium]
MTDREKIRNIAIIAHIDHGKTTLLDALLKQSNVFRSGQAVRERVMDSYDQEIERGITIFAKQTAVFHRDYKINIIDTPGHADFSAEVERILGMVNAVLLLVDASEGPMPQTRFVLSKALKMGLCPIVVLNKIDRPSADPDRALNETFDLFVELGANEKQLDFSYLYASGIGGFAYVDPDHPSDNMQPMLDHIISHVAPPEGDREAPFLMQVSTVSYDDYMGRQAGGRILNGSIRNGQTVVHIDNKGEQTRRQILRVETYLGLKKVEVEEAFAGDIVSLSGIIDVSVGETLTDPSHIVTLPPISIDEPTVFIDLSVNSSPFVGKSGQHVTMNKIRERLEKERRSNISLRIDFSEDQDKVTVAGRGELHLSVLIEAMRREGYEFSVSRPNVITKMIDGKMHEPQEKVFVEVPEAFCGVVIEDLSKRKGLMQSLDQNEQGISSLEFLMPTRGLMGYRNQFLTKTKGLGILTSSFDSFVPMRGDIPGRANGVLISNAAGKATGYSIFNLQDRGVIFASAGDEVYEGMIIGENSRDNDLIVNVVKGKQLTNVRASGTDDHITLTPPRKFNLEQAIEYIQDDELLEVTPDFLRMRKRYLTENERKRFSK